jgi:hypothetical protein
VNIRNSTAEVVENAEAGTAKCSAPGCRAKSDLYSHLSRKVKTAKGLSKKDLCALCLLFVHPLLFITGGSKGKEGSISVA